MVLTNETNHSEKQSLSFELSSLGFGVLFLNAGAYFLYISKTRHLIHCDTNLLTCFFFGWQGETAMIHILPFVTTVLIQSNTMKVKAVPSEQLHCS